MRRLSAREKVERALTQAAGANGCVLTGRGASTSWSREECRRSFGRRRVASTGKMREGYEREDQLGES